MLFHLDSSQTEDRVSAHWKWEIFNLRWFCHFSTRIREYLASTVLGLISVRESKLSRVLRWPFFCIISFRRPQWKLHIQFWRYCFYMELIVCHLFVEPISPTFWSAVSYPVTECEIVAVEGTSLLAYMGRRVCCVSNGFNNAVSCEVNTPYELFWDLITCWGHR